MMHVVNFSGGAASWMTAKRVAERYGTADMVLLFADTKAPDDEHPHHGEDQDLYRFLDEAADNIGVPVTRISEGRHVWGVFHDERFIGNHMVDPCSKILKRQMLDRWMRENAPAEVVRYFGYTFEETHRAARSIAASPWPAFAPLCEPPEVWKDQCFTALAAEGIDLPRLYRLGFQHNNCGGFCVKAGQAQMAHLYRVMPERYAYHEAQEEAMRVYLDKDVSVMRDRSGGEVKTLTLRDFRLRIERQPSFFDADDWAGCGCMTPMGEAA